MNRARSRYSGTDFQFVRVRLSTEEFGIDLGDVKEILRPRALDVPPYTPPFAEGMCRLRGMSVPVVDMRKRFSLRPEMTDSERIIIAGVGSHVAGLIVDEVKDIAMGGREVFLRPGAANSEPWSHLVEAVIETGKVRARIIGLAGLFTEEERAYLNAPLSEFLGQV